ncbi:hypothetical protein [Nostoc sp. UIC 10630]|uniref:hypothetical protein n=1 Tax=Nostoc sp. UIC 10630 TaxID=2100146 RepID=UPI0013D0721F|nr:hypothetical protein [Nostoc sp. UIC 10630]NEU77627.1 hypothetical protein [Nostoc sp. UIC 10630]
MQTFKHKEPRPWPAAVREFVQEEQEDAYRLLAIDLGLGQDPAKAFAHLNKDLPPGPDILPQTWKNQLGIFDALTPEEWAQFDEEVAQVYEYYAALPPPTYFETRSSYLTMAMLFDTVGDAFGKALRELPFPATLPSGDVNARIVLEPKTKAPVMFFEQGLFRFFMDMAQLIAWATPPLCPAQLNDDFALTQLVRHYTMPFQASESWAGSLYTYVASGSPIANPTPLPRPNHNLFVAILLLGYMERFVMAHELAHITLGHLGKKPKNVLEAWEQEYEADEQSLVVLSELARRSGISWATCFWGCNLALTCFDILDRALGLMAFGSYKLTWTSCTHPDGLSRRNRLRGKATSLAPHVTPLEVAAAEELCGMTDALLPKVYELGSFPLVLSHQQGVRPSPLWKGYIARSFQLASCT